MNHGPLSSWLCLVQAPCPRKDAPDGLWVSLPAWAGLGFSGFCFKPALLTQVSGKQTSLFSLWSPPVVPQFSEIFPPWGSCQENLGWGAFFLCSSDTSTLDPHPELFVCSLPQGTSLAASVGVNWGFPRLPWLGWEFISMSCPSSFPGLPKNLLHFNKATLTQLQSLCM